VKVFNGLSSTEARERLAKYGLNKLPEEKDSSIFLKIIDALKGDVLMLILLGAAIISGLLGEFIEGGIILFLVSANVFIGLWQEKKAEKATDALRKMASTTAVVIRDKKKIDIKIEEIVPGDVLALEAGDKIAADAMVLDSEELQIDESMMTGESVPVSKNEKDNLFGGTTVTAGIAYAKATATGIKSALGRIAEQMALEEKPLSPLTQEMTLLAEILGTVILLACVVVTSVLLYHNNIPHHMNFGCSFGLLAMVLAMLFSGMKKWLRTLIAIFGFSLVAYTIYLFKVNGFDFNLLKTIFVFAVALAVGIIPEALVTIIAMALSYGALGMSKVNVIIKDLIATETLGCTSIILSDKTGTLTQNKMTVKEVLTNDSRKLMKCGVFCSTATIMRDENGHKYTSGDPMEGALLALGEESGIKKDREPAKIFPFSSSRKMMSVVVAEGDKFTVYAKGALESIGLKSKCDNEQKEILSTQSDSMQKNALRVLAFASKHAEKIPESEEEAESGLTILGLVGIIDPPRADVEEAVRQAKNAGIRIIMVTGDAPKIAEVIAGQIGILRKDLHHQVVTGDKLAKMNSDEIAGLMSLSSSDITFARTFPEQKAQIAKVLQNQFGEVVAVTGDGVNDALALNVADLGVAMGSGSDVAKEASSMILANDSLSSLIKGIEEGRKIYKNVKKTVYYLLSTNFAEMFAILYSLFMDIPIFFSAILILIINVGTETPPAFGLGIDRIKDDVMKDKPRTKSQTLMSGSFLLKNFWLGAIGAVSIILSYYWVTQDPYKLMNVAFFILVCERILLSYSMRSEKVFLFERQDNWWIISATFISLFFLWLTSFSFATRHILKVPAEIPTSSFMLNSDDLIKCGVLIFGCVALEEIRKVVARIRAGRIK